ncbi:MAG: hypothetical protein ACLGSD_14460 [Acidobacteriota bacterium]
MWVDLWEKLRGYNKWTETEALVQAPAAAGISHCQSEDEPGWNGEMLVWTDQHGNRRSAPFIVPDDCTLYQKVAGDTLVIRYNPRDPDRFYLRQLYRVRVRTTFKRVLIAASIIGLIVIGLWVREKP